MGPFPPSHPSGAKASCLPDALAHRKVGGAKEGEKGNTLPSQGSQRWRMRQKPPLTEASLPGPSGPALTLPRLGGHLLPSRGAVELPCQGCSVHTHPLAFLTSWEPLGKRQNFPGPLIPHLLQGVLVATSQGCGRAEDHVCVSCLARCSALSKCLVNVELGAFDGFRPLHPVPLWVLIP